MRLLLAAVLVAAAAWSAFWWLGARGTERDLTDWLAARHSDGWVANHGEITTTGFPNRFDTLLPELELADPQSGIAWSTPQLKLFQLSYQPRHVIALLAADHVLSVPGERIEITQADARGSFVFGAGETWPLERSNLEATELSLASSVGWSAEMALARLATRPSERVPGAMDIGLFLQGFTPASPLVAELASADILPPAIERIELDAALSFDRPWDLPALETQRPSITAMDIRLATLNWGQAEIWAAGAVDIDRSGRPTGSITVKLTNWRVLLDGLRGNSRLPGAALDTVEAALEVLSLLAGAQDTLDVPLRLDAGQVAFGPVSLGEIRIFQPR